MSLAVDEARRDERINALSTRVGDMLLSGYPVLLVGPHGTGKTLIARKAYEHYKGFVRHTDPAVERAWYYRSVGMQFPEDPPFRAPYYSVSRAGLLGLRAYPGEVHLAHGGVLFLDEISEFSSGTMHELGRVWRANGTSVWNNEHPYTLPAHFGLIATCDSTVESLCRVLAFGIAWKVVRV